MGTDSQVPLAQRLKCCHLLDAVRVEVLQLEPVLVEDRSDEPPHGDGEATLVEGHERDNIPSRRAWHRLLSGKLPLYGIGEQRKLPGFDEAAQH
jgi:hypothetical protein